MELKGESVDDIWRARLHRAARMTPEERMLDGPRLFDYACKMTYAGIRAQNPGISDERMVEVLRQRLALSKQWEEKR